MNRIVWIAVVLFSVGLSPVGAQDTLPESAEILFDSPAAEGLFNQGLMLYNSKNYHKAIEKFEEAIKIDPGNPETYYYIGYSYYKLKDMAKAIEVFDQAYEVDPEYTPILRIPPDERPPLGENEPAPDTMKIQEPDGVEAPVR